MDKAELRPLVFKALRTNDGTHPVDVAGYVDDKTTAYEPADEWAVREILWELLVQGILAPGACGGKPDLPWFHLTEYGTQCLEEDAVVPHDPDAYLKRLKQSIGQTLDDIVLAYTTESLHTFLSGCYMAATVMLGVASERCVDLLIEAYVNGSANASDKKAFDHEVKRAGRSVKRRFDVLRGNLLANLPPALEDGLETDLDSGIFTLIRRSRNDAGHPAGCLVDRDTARANLLLFPGYCKRVYALTGYLSSGAV